MGAAHAGRVERDHVHRVPEAELLARQRGAGAQLHARIGGVEEELGRVVAGLAVDLDRAREVGRSLVVEPVVVGEPGVRLGDGDELARPRVVEAGRALSLVVQDEVDAGQLPEQVAHRRQKLGLADVDVGHLVVGHGERARRPRVEVLHPLLREHLQQALAPEQAVDVDWPCRRRDPVLGEHDDLDLAGTCRVDQVPRDLVDRASGLVRRCALGAEPLQVVVEVRQVDESAAPAARARARARLPCRSTPRTRCSRSGPSTGRAGRGRARRAAPRGARPAPCSSRATCARRRGRPAAGSGSGRWSPPSRTTSRGSPTAAPARARRAASQSFSPWTSALCWRQKKTSPRSRKYQPLPTIPWPEGGRPVRKVDCTEQVTAGSTVPSSAWNPSPASAESRGMWRRSFGVSPTTSRTSSFRLTRPPPSARARAAARASTRPPVRAR